MRNNSKGYSKVPGSSTRQAADNMMSYNSKKANMIEAGDSGANPAKNNHYMVDYSSKGKKPSQY